ncbi:hypothetical protein Tco_1073701 [Tanacetum coccineum]
MTNKIDTVLKVITDRIAGALPSDTVKNLKLSTYPVLSARSYLTEDPHAQPMSMARSTPSQSTPSNRIVKTNDDSFKDEPEAGQQEVKYFDVLPTRSELAYHKYLMCEPIPSIFLRTPSLQKDAHQTLRYHATLDMCMENSNRGINNFTGRIKRMHVFIGNFTYITDFITVEDISSIIDPRLSQVVLGRPFIKISNMTHDPPEGVVRFTNENDEVAYKMPHNIEQYNSLSNLGKENTKSVYLINEEDKRRGVKYVMSKILGFYKEYLELGPEYLTGMDNEGEVT